MVFAIDHDASLRCLELADSSSLFSVVDSNRAHLREWLPWLDRNTEESHSEDFISSTILQFERREGFVCGIFFKKELVGTCGYHPINPGSKEATIGYWLAKSATGKGLVTKSTKILIDHGFNELGLSKINIPVAVGNAHSRAVCERLGLEIEGVKKNAEFLYDKYVDHLLYYTNPNNWQP